MEGNHSHHSTHHTEQPFVVENTTFGSPFEEVSIMRHSLFWTIFLVFAYFVVFVLGIVGNAMVIWVLTVKKEMKSVTNLFIRNLAIADMSVIIFCIPPTLLANIFVPWLLGSFLCKAVSYVQGVSVCASSYSLVAISLDRCLAIRFPMKMPGGLRTSQARLIIIGIWASAATISLPWLIAFRVIPSGRDGEEYCVESWPESMDSSIFFLIGNLILCYGFPLALIVISSVLIWCHVEQRKVPQDSASPADIERVHQKTRQAVFKMLFIVILTFFVSWLPLYLIFLLIKLGGPMSEAMENIIYIAMPLAQWMGASNSSCNPILYAFLNQSFRDSFKSLINLPSLIPGCSSQTVHALPAHYSSNMSLNLQLHSIQLGSRRLNNFQDPIGHV